MRVDHGMPASIRRAGTPGSWAAHRSRSPTTLGAAALTDYFLTLPRPDLDVLDVDFDRDVDALRQTSAIHDADATFLTTFAARGGKLLIFHGVSDPVFSAHDIRDWYLQLQHDMGADIRCFTRLFMLPGMTHCGGGAGLDDIGPLTALFLGRGQLPGQKQPGAQQICPYPQTAVYRGGDERAAASFGCQ